VAEIAKRLMLLEQRPASGTAPDPQLDEFVKRVKSLEQRLESGDNADGPRVDTLAVRLEQLESRGGAADPRVPELLARIETWESRGGSSTDPRVPELMARLDGLEKSSARGGSSPDPRLPEFIARLESMEKRQPANGGIDPQVLEERLKALEAGREGSPTFQAEIRARYEDLQHRLSQFEQTGPTGDVKSLVHKESERWTQWARNTLSEIGELRQRVEAVAKQAPAEGKGGQSGSLSEAMHALGKTITESLERGGNADLKALRSQMYFVFFTIGMLYALGAFFTYVFLSQN
jgi:hypothetical protein